MRRISKNTARMIGVIFAALAVLGTGYDIPFLTIIASIYFGLMSFVIAVFALVMIFVDKYFIKEVYGDVNKYERITAFTFNFWIVFSLLMSEFFITAGVITAGLMAIHLIIFCKIHQTK